MPDEEVVATFDEQWWQKTGKPAKPSTFWDRVDRAGERLEEISDTIGFRDQQSDAWALQPGSGLRPAKSTAREKLASGVKQLVGGVSTSTSISTAALGGFGAGLLYSGGNPWGGLIGGVAAGTAAYNTATAIDPSPDIESLPEDQRPVAYAFRVAGEGLGSIGLPHLALGANMYAGMLGTKPGLPGRLINMAINGAREAPFLSGYVEASMAVSSGALRGVSEAYYPGNALVAIPAEIIGGNINLPRITNSILNQGRGALGRLAKSMTPEGTKQEATKWIHTVAEKTKEDPAELANALREAGVLEGLTPAQRTASPLLIMLEKRVAEFETGLGGFAEIQQKKAAEAYQATHDLIYALRGTGDPQAVREAAILQSQLYRSLLATRLAESRKLAETTAKRIYDIDSPNQLSRLKIAEGTDEQYISALKEARAVEDQLYDQVDFNIEVDLTRTLKAAKEAEYDYIIRTGDWPENIKTELAEYALAKEGKAPPVTVHELQKFRSLLLREIRRERAGTSPNNVDAAAYSDIADGISEDLELLYKQTGNRALEDARAFSKELHDAFTRSAMGPATQTTGSGARRMAPELTMKMATGGTDEEVAGKLRSIHNAMRFLRTQPLPANNPKIAASVANTETYIKKMDELQGQMLTVLAAKGIQRTGPDAGLFTAESLARFQSEHKDTLELFPAISKIVDDAVNSADGLARIRRMNESTYRRLGTRVFSHAIKEENPAEFVDKVLNGFTPLADLRALSQTVNRAGRNKETLARISNFTGADPTRVSSEAKTGLLSAVWDWGFKKATHEGNFDVEKFYRAMFEPTRPGKDSVMGTLLKEGIADDGVVERINQLIGSYRKVVKAMSNEKTFNEMVQKLNFGEDMMFALGGAKIGQWLANFGPGGGMGSSLVMAGRGSSFLRDVAGNTPTGKLNNVLKEMALNEEFAIEMLERIPKGPEAIEKAGQIHAYLMAVGLTGVEGLENAMEEEPPR